MSEKEARVLVTCTCGVQWYALKYSSPMQCKCGNMLDPSKGKAKASFECPHCHMPILVAKAVE